MQLIKSSGENVLQKEEEEELQVGYGTLIEKGEGEEGRREGGKKIGWEKLEIITGQRRDKDKAKGHGGKRKKEMVTSRTVYGNPTQAIRSENSVLKISEKIFFL